MAFTCKNTAAASVRAEGFEPSRSFEHRHLKPACLPFHHARAQRSYRCARRRICSSGLVAPDSVMSPYPPPGSTF